jgi:uncharacterized protein YbbC (DUF1343 family)
VDYEKVNLMSLQFILLQVHADLYPEKNPFAMAEQRLTMFDKVCGSDSVRKGFAKQMRYDDIESFLYRDVETFREQSTKYYLYK